MTGKKELVPSDFVDAESFYKVKDDHLTAVGCELKAEAIAQAQYG